jgi:uncharacterized protein YaiL (DUF2058 family)
MEIIDQIATQVQVRFTVTDGDHTYTDALYFTPEEYASKTPEEIEAMKVQRFENWKAVVTAPPREPADEEKAEQLEALKQQQELLAQQIAALQG